MLGCIGGSIGGLLVRVELTEAKKRENYYINKRNDKVGCFAYAGSLDDPLGGLWSRLGVSLSALKAILNCLGPSWRLRLCCAVLR